MANIVKSPSWEHYPRGNLESQVQGMRKPLSKIYLWRYIYIYFCWLRHVCPIMFFTWCMNWRSCHHDRAKNIRLQCRARLIKREEITFCSKCASWYFSHDAWIGAPAIAAERRKDILQCRTMLAKEKQACVAASMPDYAPHMMHELALLPRSARTAQELVRNRWAGR